MYVPRVKNEAVWKHLKTLFFGTIVLFLINIFFGFDNSLTIGEIPRWQVLIHLHGGSIGWITYSAIGIAIWLMTGDRDVSEKYEKRIGTLVLAAFFIFASYIISFGLAFSRPSGFLVALLPVFGTMSVIILWISAIFALSNLRKQPVTTTVHLLAASALLVAAIGATMGALLGLERVVGRFLPLAVPEAERVGVHAGMMDTYLFLVASAVIEWFTRKDSNQRWRIAGLLQALFWITSAIIVPIAFFLNMLDQLLPIFGIFLLLGLIIFLARIAWQALIAGPFGKGVKTWAFFGTLWLIIYLALFLWVVGTGADFTALPFWFGAVFAHAGFIGMMTNLIIGVISARVQSARDVLTWGEPASLWIMNLGLIIFLAIKIFADIRLGAIIMGVGVLFALLTMFLRLRASD